jgi:hypothetical protein
VSPCGFVTRCTETYFAVKHPPMAPTAGDWAHRLNESDRIAGCFVSMRPRPPRPAHAAFPTPNTPCVPEFLMQPRAQPHAGAPTRGAKPGIVAEPLAAPSIADVVTLFGRCSEAERHRTTRLAKRARLKTITSAKTGAH